MTAVDPREQLRRPIDPSEYDAVRALWKRHSIAEDNRDLDGLISTLTPDCVYEIFDTPHRWEGHDGARRFYASLLGAYPDIVFSLTDIVIGPQGVCEAANVSGTHTASFVGEEPTDMRYDWRVVIFFPWDADARLFTGERIFTTLSLENS